MSVFLSCISIGLIPNGVSNVSKAVASRELIQLASIRRIQPLIKGDDNSSCVLTLVGDEGLPKGKLVLRETYKEIFLKLKTVIL
jgi:hypothetical protein